LSNMPVYLLHGFRWPRGGFTGIRVHIIIHNLDDCSAEYIQTPQSQAELLKSFRNAYPELMKELEPHTLGNGKGIQFLEQYDPDDELGETAASQPYAFVGDKVVTIAGGPPASLMSDSPVATPTLPTASEPATPASAKRSSKGSVSAGIAAATAIKTSALSLNVEEVVAEGPGVTAAAWEAFAELRDKIAPGEKIGWWVVYNGDPERPYDSDEQEEESDNDDSEVEEEEAYEEETQEEGTAREQTIRRPSPPPRKPSAPKFPIADRTRPPQPPPKARMFEQSDPNNNRSTTTQPSPPPPRSPLGSPPPKTSGKRLPGMKAVPQPASQQQQQQQQQQKVPEGSKPKIAPKSESLKKKFFGKRS
jgi:hypothetical protein